MTANIQLKKQGEAVLLQGLTSMRILLVSATYFEIAPLVAGMKFIAERNPRLKSYEAHGKHIDVLISGVGMTATAAWLSMALAQSKYDFVLNAGVCGSFSDDLKNGDVVRVTDECISELGAEDGDNFLSVFSMKLLGENEFPFMRSKLFSQEHAAFSHLSHLRAVSGITVNTVHGNDESIMHVREKFNPSVESMEGAGFYYAALIHGIPALEIRAVSNKVERRNRDKWELSLAIRNLNEVVVKFLETV